jgi:hypothetical protein
MERFDPGDRGASSGSAPARVHGSNRTGCAVRKEQRHAVGSANSNRGISGVGHQNIGLTAASGSRNALANDDHVSAVDLMKHCHCARSKCVAKRFHGVGR